VLKRRQVASLVYRTVYITLSKHPRLYHTAFTHLHTYTSWNSTAGRPYTQMQ